MKLSTSSLFVGLGLLALSCGGKATRFDGHDDRTGGDGASANGSGGDGSDTHEAAACTTSAECGLLACLCGTCRSPCDGAFVCTLPFETACVGDGPAASAPATDASFAVRPGTRQGIDLALGPDFSFFVAGSAGPDFGNPGSETHRDFWLARFDALGMRQWEVVEPQDESLSPGLSVAFGDDLLVTTLSTRFVEGPRTLVRQFGSDGTRISEEQLIPELTVVRQLPQGAWAWLGGSELMSTTGGRPFLRARVERLGEQTGRWPASFAGITGSVSAVTALALDEAGNASVSGYLGIDAESNRSVPWVARLSPSGETIFETKIAVSDDQHCSAGAVAVTHEGVTLAAGYCEGNWLKAFSPDGKLLWERRFPEPITAVAALADGGYLVATGLAADPNGNLDDNWKSAVAELLVFDAEHRLRTRVTELTCDPFHRVLVTPRGVLTLRNCARELEIAGYDLL